MFISLGQRLERVLVSLFSLRKRIVFVVIASITMIGSAPLFFITPVSATTSTTVPLALTAIPGQVALNVPPGASIVGVPSASAPMSVLVGLSSPNPSAEQSFLKELSTPGSPEYHHFLTPAEIASQFGPSASTISTVTKYFQAAGISVSLSPNHLTLALHGSASAMSTAFHTPLINASLPNGSITINATANPETTPAVASAIQFIEGLSNFSYAVPTAFGAQPVPISRLTSGERKSVGLQPPTFVSNLHAPQITAFTSATPQPSSTYTGTSCFNNGIAPRYQFNNLWGQGDLGAGSTIGLMEFYGYSPSDVSTFESCTGATGTVSATQLGNGIISPSTISAQEVISDIDVALTFAPAANVQVYEDYGSTTNTMQAFDDMINKWISDDTAKVLSSSWAFTSTPSLSSFDTGINNLLTTAALQGQTFFSASGDTGAYYQGTLATSAPTDSTYTVAVGGTQYNTSTNQESVWNQYSAASGGGVSNIQPLPSYQTTKASGYSTSCATASSTGCRQVPDVSALAYAGPGTDQAYYTIYCASECGGSGYMNIGGTSLATPLWASGITLVNEVCKTTQGWMNPSLYTWAKSDPSIFNDITIGSNSISYPSGETVAYDATTGYDMATGLGSPNFANLATYLCNSSVGTPPANAPTLNSSVSSVNFGTINPSNSTVTPQEIVALSNTGSTPISISGIQASGNATVFSSGLSSGSISQCGSDSSSGGIGSFSLDIGSICRFAVQYSMVSNVNASGQVTVTSNASNPSLVIPVVASLVSPNAATLSLTPSSLNFGTRDFGAATSAQTVTITNTSSVNAYFANPATPASINTYLTIPSGYKQLENSGTPGMAIQSTTCGNTLAPGNTCTVTVTETPGYMDWASTYQAVSQGTETTSFPLFADVTTPPVIQATANLVVGNLTITGSTDFGTVAVGSVTDRTITYATGNTALFLDSYLPQDASFSVQSSTCYGTVPANSTCTVTVQYAPTTIGSQSITLESFSNAPITTALTLTGTAVGNNLTNTSTSDFGTVSVGTAKDLYIDFTAGGGAVTFSSAPVLTGSSAFTVVGSGNTCTGTINALATCSVEVAFTPTAAAAATGTLTLTDNAANSPQLIPLTATGTTPPVTTPPVTTPPVTTPPVTTPPVTTPPVTTPPVTTPPVTTPPVTTPPVTTPHFKGYWVVTSTGQVNSIGGSQNFGSVSTPHLNKPVVGLAPTPNGNGYWLVASDGGIFSFGSAKFYGSTGAMTLNKPVVGMTSTSDGKGYWLVASDGGIFSFGSAKFYGSTGAMTLNKPVVGMTSTSDGKGYWMVASDGGIFSFGDAQFYGSTGAMTLNKPIVGMAATPDGKGYWLVASDGGVFTFGDARFYGSTGNLNLTSAVVAIKTTGDGKGYTIYTADGNQYPFGDATAS